MSMTGLEVFDTTVHKTNAWLNRLMILLELSEKRAAYEGLRATLQTLRDRLTVDESAQFAAQLPMLVRGFYYEGWDPSRTPVKLRDVPSFLAAIEDRLPSDYPRDSEAVALAVFALIEENVSGGEVADVLQLVPGELRSLWVRPPAGTA